MLLSFLPSPSPVEDMKLESQKETQQEFDSIDLHNKAVNFLQGNRSF